MKKDFKKHLVYFLIFLISFLLFFSFSELGRSIQMAMVRSTSLPVKILSFPLQELKKILFYHRTFEAYKFYRHEAENLRARLVGMKEILEENARLNNLLGFKRGLLYSSIAAAVIGRNPSLWNASILIDKGEQDEIKEGAAVVNAYGVVGKVTQVTQKTAKVILLTDPQFNVAVIDQRSRESGLISGTLQGKLRMRYISEQADIREEDEIVTSKLSSSFPESLLVGKVIHVIGNSRGSGIECLVEPAVAVSQLEEVLVITNSVEKN